MCPEKLYHILFVNVATPAQNTLPVEWGGGGGGGRDEQEAQSFYASALGGGGGGGSKQECLDPVYWNAASKNKKNQKVSLSLKLSEQSATYSV